MGHMKQILPIVGLFTALQVHAAIRYGKEIYPADADSLIPVAFSGQAARPVLAPTDSGVKLSLSGTGGTCGVVKKIGTVQGKGDYIHFLTRISNPTPSFVSVEFQLYNVRDKRILAKSPPVVIRNSESPPVNISLEYTPDKQDIGDLLILRWVQTSTEHPSRSFCIEELEVERIRPLDVIETFPAGDPGRLEPAVFTGEAALPTLRQTTTDSDNGDGRCDGAVEVYSSEIGGTYGAAWNLGTLEKADVPLRIETVWSAAGNSYVRVDVQLCNRTTETILASSGDIIAKNAEALPTTVTLDYTLGKADKGCELEVRWVQTSTEHSSRNFIIDRFSVAESQQ